MEMKFRTSLVFRGLIMLAASAQLPPPELRTTRNTLWIRYTLTKPETSAWPSWSPRQ